MGESKISDMFDNVCRLTRGLFCWPDMSLWPTKYDNFHLGRPRKGPGPQFKGKIDNIGRPTNMLRQSIFLVGTGSQTPLLTSFVGPWNRPFNGIFQLGRRACCMDTGDIIGV